MLNNCPVLDLTGSETEWLEAKLCSDGIKVHKDAGRGQLINGKPLVDFTKRIKKKYDTMERRLKGKPADDKMKAFLATPLCCVPRTLPNPSNEEHSEGRVTAHGAVVRRLSMGGMGLDLRNQEEETEAGVDPPYLTIRTCPMDDMRGLSGSVLSVFSRPELP